MSLFDWSRLGVQTVLLLGAAGFALRGLRARELECAGAVWGAFVLGAALVWNLPGLTPAIPAAWSAGVMPLYAPAQSEQVGVAAMLEVLARTWQQTTLLHGAGACLAFWLFGLRLGLAAMFAVLLLSLGYCVVIGDAARALAHWDVAFFDICLPLLMLWLWRRLWLLRLRLPLQQRESLASPQAPETAALLDATLPSSKLPDSQPTPTSTPTPTAAAEPAAEELSWAQWQGIVRREHFPHRVSRFHLRDYFVHFFTLVFAGTAFATFASVLAFGLAHGRALDLMLAPATLLAYMEAFLTGLLYTVLHFWLEDHLYPYSP